MKKKRTIALILLWLLCCSLPPFLLSAALIYPDWQAVRATGMCPAAPPDIPPYPCTPNEFLTRMVAGPFAVMGFMILCLSWGVMWGGFTAVVGFI
ncbi:MAG: hypothetical protein KDD89_08425 [Anaerolineales bacterium]|nr:hypothetical protein [Anaerolineales bacterium]